ncbi:MAG: hypothetical protein H6506_00600 [Calditrichaeota bacterium]|nr:hypothetical protein [Calditrichota bacterium]
MLMAFLAGCAQRETDIGSDLIPLQPQGNSGQTTIFATHSAEWDRDLSTGRGSTLQVGEARDFVTVSALRFQPLDVLPDSFVLDTARIRFRVDRIYPARGEAPDLRMLIKQIPIAWYEDSLKEGTFADRSSYPVIDTILIPTGAGAVDSLYWKVPDSVWASWLVDDSLNHGILLEADNPDVIVGFQTAEGAENFRTFLEIIGQEFSTEEGAEPVAWDDTLYATDDGYVAEDLSEPVPGRLRISQGAYRRALLYFPLDSVTSNPLRTVVRARIHFFADLGVPNSLVYSGSNFLYKDASLADTSWFAEPDSASQSFVAVSSSSFGSDNTEIVFENTSVVASLVGNPETNGGFSIQATLESDVVSRQFFHAYDSEVDSLRPRLEIWWVEP